MLLLSFIISGFIIRRILVLPTISRHYKFTLSQCSSCRSRSLILLRWSQLILMVFVVILLLIPHIILYRRQVALSASDPHHRLIIIWLCQFAIAEWILNHVGLDGGQRFSKLWETQLGVAIQVESPHNRQQLRPKRLMTGPFQKSADRSLVNYLVVLVVYCFESPADRETVEAFQVLLQLLESQLEVYLFG